MFQLEKVVSQKLFTSDFYEIKGLSCDFSRDKAPLKGFNDCFCLMLVNTGGLQFNVSKDAFDLHTGHILIDKPDYEYRMQATVGQCTVFNFSDNFYQHLVEEMQLDQAFFFSNSGALSMLMKSSPEIEYLHHQLLKYTPLDKMALDGLIIEIVGAVVKNMGVLKSGLTSFHPKKFHLPIIERAKEYIHQHFQTDFSLFDLSNFAYASPFHFSRIFKKYTSVTPHQYLLHVRIKHSEMLLKNTTKSITEIAFQSGFNNAEYFATAFKQKYGLSPSKYKQKSPEAPTLFRGFQIP